MIWFYLAIGALVALFEAGVFMLGRFFGLHAGRREAEDRQARIDSYAIRRHANQIGQIAVIQVGAEADRNPMFRERIAGGRPTSPRGTPLRPAPPPPRDGGRPR